MNISIDKKVIEELRPSNVLPQTCLQPELKTTEALKKLTTELNSIKWKEKYYSEDLMVLRLK